MSTVRYRLDCLRGWISTESRFVSILFRSGRPYYSETYLRSFFTPAKHPKSGYGVMYTRKTEDPASFARLFSFTVQDPLVERRTTLYPYSYDLTATLAYDVPLKEVRSRG